MALSMAIESGIPEQHKLECRYVGISVNNFFVKSALVEIFGQKKDGVPVDFLESNLMEKFLFNYVWRLAVQRSRKDDSNTECRVVRMGDRNPIGIGQGDYFPSEAEAIGYANKRFGGFLYEVRDGRACRLQL